MSAAPLILGAGLLALLAVAMATRVGMIQYPFLATAVVAGWAYPQIIGLALMRMVPSEALLRTSLFILLCLTAATLGHARGLRQPIRVLRWRLSRSRLLVGSLILSLVGYAFNLQVDARAAEMAAMGGQWTGIITVYVFFGSMQIMGLIVAAVTQIHAPSRLGIGIIAFDLLMMLERIVVGARRETMVEAFLILVLALWFARRWAPPRSMVLAAVVVGTFVVNATSQLRSVDLGAQSGLGSFAARLATLDDIGYVRAFRSAFVSVGSVQELLNASLAIEGADRRLEFDLGAFQWNRAVHSYVPATFLGREFKESLQFDLPDFAAEEFGLRHWTGTTSTGFADAFASFWWFGAGVFWLIGWLMGRWFRAATLGSPAAQMVLMAIAAKSLLAITHTTPHFFLRFVDVAAFLLPVLWWARIAGSPEPAPGPASPGPSEGSP